MFILAWFCFYFLTRRYGFADEKCWTIDDVRSKKDGFILCPKSVIVVKDFKEYPTNYCFRYDKLKELQKCNGLYTICDINDVDILTTIEENVDSCSYGGKPQKICIMYDCIPGPINNMTDNTALTKVSGSLFQPVLLHGFVRCSIFGHITNISVAKSASAISIRDENGTKMICYRNNGPFRSYPFNLWKHQKFSLTTAVEMNAMEVTIVTTDVCDIILEVEGGQYYKCQSDIYYKQELDDDLSATKDGNKCLWLYEEQLYVTATILSTLLSMVLTGVYVTQCLLLHRKNKHLSLKTKSPLNPSSRRPLHNEFESPHWYMDVAV